MKRKTVPELVRKYAEEWRDEYVARPTDASPNPMKKFVQEYMHETFFDLLDHVLGIDRRFGRIELIGTATKMKDGEPPTIIELVMKKYSPLLQKEVERLLEGATIKLTQREVASLRRVYREELFEKAQERVRALAEERAMAIAEHELDKLMADDEWVVLVEGRVTKKQEDDDG